MNTALRRITPFKLFWFLFSIVCFNSALIAPYYCGNLIFLFLLPLAFYSAEYGFFYGFLWGVACALIQGLPWWHIAIVHLSDYWGWIVSGIGIFYIGLLSGIWFHLSSLRKGRGWIPFTFFYFYFIDCFFFVICGIKKGYCLMYPLTALSNISIMYEQAEYWGRYGMLFLLIIGAAAVTHFIKHFDLLNLFLATLSLSPFFIGFSKIPSYYSVPSYVSYLMRGMVEGEGIRKGEHAVTQDIVHLVETSEILLGKEAYLFLPESAYPFPLNARPDTMECWAQNGITDRVTLILGAHSHIAGAWYNSAYMIRKGKVTSLCHKECLIPFIEYLSPLLQTITGYTTLIPHSVNFSPYYSSTSWKLKEIGEIDVYICSDFFLSPSARTGNVILVLINEQWWHARYPWITELMRRHALLKGREWRKPLIFIGYSLGFWASFQGVIIELPTAPSRVHALYD